MALDGSAEYCGHPVCKNQMVQAIRISTRRVRRPSSDLSEIQSRAQHDLGVRGRAAINLRDHPGSHNASVTSTSSAVRWRQVLFWHRATSLSRVLTRLGASDLCVMIVHATIAKKRVETCTCQAECETETCSLRSLRTPAVAILVAAQFFRRLHHASVRPCERAECILGHEQ